MCYLHNSFIEERTDVLGVCQQCLAYFESNHISTVLTPFFLPLPEAWDFSGVFLAGLAGIFLPDVPAFCLGAVLALGFFGFNSSGATSLPPFLFFRSSGWILGRTPPDAIVTPFSNWGKRNDHENTVKPFIKHPYSWEICPENNHKIGCFLPIAFWQICPQNFHEIPAKSANFSTNLSLKIPHNLTFFPTTFQKPCFKLRLTINTKLR